MSRPEMSSMWCEIDARRFVPSQFVISKEKKEEGKLLKIEIKLNFLNANVWRIK